MLAFLPSSFFPSRSLALPKNGSIKIPEIVFFKYFYISRYLLYFFFSFARLFAAVIFISPLVKFFLCGIFSVDRLKSRFSRGSRALGMRESAQKHSSAKEIFHSWKRSRRKLHMMDLMPEFLLHFVKFQFRSVDGSISIYQAANETKLD